MANPLAIPLLGASVLGGFLGGNSQAKASREANRLADRRAREATGFLTADSIGSQFSGLQSLFGGQIAGLIASQGLAGQIAGQSARAGLGRAGLGSTGLGTALSAGFGAGAAFQGGQLRARILSELLSQAIQTRAQQASVLSGTPVVTGTGTNGVTAAIQGVGAALEAGSALGVFK